jgi:hypothetical protein
MLDDYFEKARLCKSANDFNRLHIDIERHLSPNEFVDLGRKILGAQPPLPPPCAYWAKSLGGLLAQSGQPVPTFVRHPISDSAYLLALPGPREARRDRTLVVCFTDWTRRMMMPLPLFMQHTPPACDYLVLFDFARTFYLGGVPGLADSLDGLAEHLGRWIPEQGYRRVVSIGSSSGGLGSLWCPVVLGWARGVSIAGATPGGVPERLFPPGTHTMDDFAKAVDKHRDNLPEIRIVFSDGNVRDTAKAEAIARIIPTTLERIQGAHDHNVLYEVYMRGEMGDMMRRMILPV